jgi:hypothetical protein
VDRRDGLIHLQVNAAERVGDLLEAAEVDCGHVVEVDVRHALDRADGAWQAAEGERGVDLRSATGVAAGVVGGRDLHPQVARDRDDLGAVVVGWDVHDHQRVGAPLAGRCFRCVRIPRVTADDQDVQRAVDRLGRAAVGDVGERVGPLEVLVQSRGVAVQRDRGDDAADHDHDAGDQGDTTPVRLPLAPVRPAGSGPTRA